MRSAQIAGVAFVTGFSGAIMPGTMLVLTIGQVSAHGFWAAPAIVLGHALLELVVVAALIGGLRQVLRNRAVRGTVGIAGGAALLYMGWDMYCNAAGQAIDLTQRQQALPWGMLILQGAVVCIVNPYFVAWWATIGAGQMAQLKPENAREYVAFYLGHEMADVVWYCFVGIVIALGGRLISLSWLIVVCAVVVAGLGVWFVYSGVRAMRDGEVAEEATKGKSSGEEAAIEQERGR